MTDILDLSKTIIAKSDQLNADDLIGGPRTVTITQVRGMDDAQQPIAVGFKGDDNKPYKPCKSMRRVMVYAWGKNGHDYVGHSMTLYCDPEVVFGGIKTGGIRISHMSHIDHEMVVPLQVSKGKRQPYKVAPLRLPTPAKMDADFETPRRDSDAHDPLRVPMDDLNADERLAWGEAFKAKCLKEGGQDPQALMRLWRTYFDLQLTPLYGCDKPLYDSLETWFGSRMKKARQAENSA